jgi:uncharacterized OB-fold protein
VSGTNEYPDRPRPQPTDGSEGFWAGCERGELMIQACTSCGELRHYPQPLCPLCHCFEFEWRRMSGRGVVYSYCIAHRAFHPAWAERTPYVVATIEIEEGVRMVSDLQGVAPDEVRIGMPVEVFFERVDEQTVLPRFRAPDA